MAVVISCSKGHRWELQSLHASAEQLTVACPVCGAATDLSASSDSLQIEGNGSASSKKRKRARSVSTVGEKTKSKSIVEESRTVAGYELLGELGRGGMGVVYWAWQKALNRVVALKMVLAGAHASKTELARFRTEAEAVAGLQHPNVVQIYSIGEADGCPYIVLEFVEGGNLARKTLSKAQSPKYSAQLVEVLARTIHFAHKRGIIHRDLKPSNILLTSDGVPKITDFGLAKRLEIDGTGPTRTGAVLGTPSYMAPEQSGKSKKAAEIGPQTDVYSLGTILYELLTGRPPFRADNPLDTLMQVLNDEPIAPTKFQPRIPKDLETIALKCLNKEPEKRYDTAEDLAEDLRRYLNNEPIKAQPISTMGRAIKWAARHPTVAAMLGVTAVALIALIFVSLGYNIYAQNLIAQLEKQKKTETKLKTQAQQGQEREAAQRSLAEEERRRALAGEMLARRHLYAGNMTLAQQSLRENNMKRALELLEAQKPLFGQPDLRGFEWYYLHRFCHREFATLTGHENAVTAVAHSPDGLLLASGSRDRTIRLWNLSSRTEIAVLKGHQDWIRAVAFSPDGATFATASDDRTIKLWDSTSHQEIATLNGHSGQVQALAFSPDGDLLATGGRDHTIRIWELPQVRERKVFSNLQFSVGSLVFSPDGQTLYSANGGESATASEVKAWNLESGIYRSLPTDAHKGEVSLAITPNGGSLIAGGDDTLIKVWDTESLELQNTFEGHTAPIRSLALSGDGAVLASAGFDATIRLWHLTDGSLRDTYYGHVGPISGVRFNPIGDQFTTSGHDQTIKFWKVAAEKPTDIIQGHDEQIQCLRFTPDGGQMVVGDWGGNVSIWDTRSRSRIETFRAHTSPIYAAVFSPEGATLATAGSTDETVKLWEAPEGSRELQKTFIGHVGGVTDLAFTSDGAILATGAKSGIVRLWNVETGRLVTTLEGHADMITSMKFGPDDRTIATGSLDQTVRVWNIADGQGQPIHVFKEFAGPVHAVAFSPDGKSLAAGSLDTEIRIWNLTNGRPQARLTGHTAGVTTVGYSPDGRSIASAGMDQTIKFWDPQTGQERATLTGHTNDIIALAFSPDGKTLASGGYDKTLRLWHAAEVVNETLADFEELVPPE